MKDKKTAYPTSFPMMDGTRFHGVVNKHSLYGSTGYVFVVETIDERPFIQDTQVKDGDPIAPLLQIFLNDARQGETEWLDANIGHRISFEVSQQFAPGFALNFQPDPVSDIKNWRL